MTKETLDNVLEELEISAVAFELPSYLNAIIGISHDDRLIYDYDNEIITEINKLLKRIKNV